MAVVVTSTASVPGSWRICLIGSARYAHPADPSTRAKLEALSTLGELLVLGTAGEGGIRPLTFRVGRARIVRLPLPSNRLVRYPIRLFFSAIVVLITHLRRPFDVIVAQGPQDAVPALLARGVKRPSRERTRVVIEMHSDMVRSPVEEFGLGGSAVAESIVSGVSSVLLRRADGIRAVSPAGEAQARSATDAPTWVFPAWMYLRPFVEAGSERTHGSGERFIFAGRLSPVKGLEDLVGAFTRTWEATGRGSLTIVGPPVSRSYESALVELIDSSPAASRISLKGAVDREALAMMFADHDVLVLPSLTESFGRVVVEAMTAGLACVATRTPGGEEVLRSGGGVLVDPGDVEGLATVMIDLVEDQHRVQDLGKDARTIAAERWSEDSYVQRYREMIVDLSTREPAPMTAGSDR